MEFLHRKTLVYVIILLLFVFTVFLLLSKIIQTKGKFVAKNCIVFENFSAPTHNWRYWMDEESADIKFKDGYMYFYPNSTSNTWVNYCCIIERENPVDISKYNKIVVIGFGIRMLRATILDNATGGYCGPVNFATNLNFSKKIFEYTLKDTTYILPIYGKYLYSLGMHTDGYAGVKLIELCP
jgi:hypothetical protein